MEIRDRHFQRLKSYRMSAEYAAFAKLVGMDDPPFGEILPSLIGVRWQIDERIYDEFLNLLPPMRWTGNSFLISEFVFGSITTKYTKEGDRYFCEFFDTRKGT